MHLLQTLALLCPLAYIAGSELNWAELKADFDQKYSISRIQILSRSDIEKIEDKKDWWKTGRITKEGETKDQIFDVVSLQVKSSRDAQNKFSEPIRFLFAASDSHLAFPQAVYFLDTKSDKANVVIQYIGGKDNLIDFFNNHIIAKEGHIEYAKHYALQMANALQYVKHVGFQGLRLIPGGIVVDQKEHKPDLKYPIKIASVEGLKKVSEGEKENEDGSYQLFRICVWMVARMMNSPVAEDSESLESHMGRIGPALFPKGPPSLENVVQFAKDGFPGLQKAILEGMEPRDRSSSGDIEMRFRKSSEEKVKEDEEGYPPIELERLVVRPPTKDYETEVPPAEFEFR